MSLLASGISESHSYSRKILSRLAYWRLRFHYLILGARRQRRLVLEQVGRHSLLVLPGVMNPILFKTGEFLARTLKAEWFSRQDRVLDLGSGTGIVSVLTAGWVHSVVAVDINPAAVRCTRANVLIHGLEDRVEVREGDLFQAVAGERFEKVIFNPPYLKGEPRSDFERALYAPAMAGRFAEDLHEHLVPGGIAYLVLSTRGAEAEFLDSLQSAGFSTDRVAEEDLFIERIRLFAARRASSTLP